MFTYGFIAGVIACVGLLGIAKARGYIAIGKGERADKIDDDAKALRDGIKKRAG